MSMKLSLYSSSWCASCKTIKKSLEALDTSEIFVQTIDIDNLDTSALSKVQVRSIPTLILQDSEGNELKRKSGAMTTEQLKQWLEI